MSKPQSAMMQHRPTGPPSMPRAIPPSGSPTPSHNPITMSTLPQTYQPMQAPTTMWTTQSITGQQQMINPGQPMGYPQQMYVAYNQPYQHYYPQASPNNNSVYFAPMQQQPSQPQVINQGQPPGRPPSAPGMAGPPMGPPTIPPQHSILQQNQQPMSIPTGYPMQRVPMMTPMPQPAQAPPAPRKRNVIAIVDPTTNEAINEEQLLDSQSVHSLGSTPPSVDRMTPTHAWPASENQAPQPNKSVSEEFKKQVLAKLDESSPSDHPSMENGPADSQDNHSECADAAANGVETSDEASLNRVGMGFASSSARSTDANSSKRTQIIRYQVERGANVKRKSSNGTDVLALAAVDPAVQEHITHAEKPPSYNKCVVCCLEQATIRFQPCGHMIACTDCSVMMNKCLSCKSTIGRKLKHDDIEVLAATAAPQPVNEESKILKQQLQEYEESFQCNICLDNRLSVVFLCGHYACKDCAEAISQCHMCREPITKRIHLYR